MRLLEAYSELLESKGWFALKKHFKVAKPLFHATSGVRASGIAKEGLKTAESRRGTGTQVGISTTRELGFALKSDFGNFIFVLDENELQRKFKVEPMQYTNWGDEREERVLTDHIPVPMIRGLIVNVPLSRYERKWWAEQGVPFPVVVLTKDDKWAPLEEGVQQDLVKLRAALADPSDQRFELDVARVLMNPNGRQVMYDYLDGHWLSIPYKKQVRLVLLHLRDIVPDYDILGPIMRRYDLVQETGYNEKTLEIYWGGEAKRDSEEVELSGIIERVAISRGIEPPYFIEWASVTVRGFGGDFEWDSRIDIHPNTMLVVDRGMVKNTVFSEVVATLKKRLERAVESLLRG